MKLSQLSEIIRKNKNNATVDSSCPYEGNLGPIIKYLNHKIIIIDDDDIIGTIKVTEYNIDELCKMFINIDKDILIAYNKRNE